MAFQADICQQDQCQAMYDAVVRIFRRVDICIVSPGSGWHPEPIDKLDTTGALDDMIKEIAPLYNLMPLVLPSMYERKWGRFIGISMGFSMPSPSYAYDAAKAARTDALRRAWSEAWRRLISISAHAIFRKSARSSAVSERRTSSSCAIRISCSFCGLAYYQLGVATVHIVSLIDKNANGSLTG